MAIFPTGSGVFLKKESQRIGRRFVGPVSPGQPGPAPSMTPRWRRKRPIPPCALFWFTNAMQMWYTLMGHSYSLPAASVFPRLWAAPPTTTTMTTLGHYNPLRYRGYVYDTETGLYYLNSRYYNPTWGRFINADAELAGIGGATQGYSLFAYCHNNPVNMSDSDGNWPKWLTGAANAVSGVLQMVAGAAVGTTLGWTGFGAVAAGFLMANGAATATQGIGQVVNSVSGSRVLREDNIIRTGVQAAGNAIGGPTGAMIAGALYDGTATVVNIYAGKVISTPSQCFIAGTAVLTVAGNRAIETIKAGDMVWAENPETGEKELKTVVQTFVNETSELIHVCVNGEEIITTTEHPFYSPVKGWTAACKLRAGDILVLQSGKYVIVEKVQHEILEAPIAVYNFEVEDFHTYYVGKSAVLVHNACQRMGKQKGNAPRSNQAQNRQFDSIIKEYHLTKSEARQLHDSITGQGYGRSEIIEELISLFPEKR